MKQLVQKALGQFGYTLRKLSTLHGYDPGSVTRPIGEVNLFLEDVRARGFVPRGIMDVGAYNGDWARMALSIFPDTPILMIEPQDEMEVVLSELVKSVPNRYYVKAGAGRASGKMVQYVWVGGAGSSFLTPATAELARTAKERVTPIVTIDSLLAGQYPSFAPDLVKLDVQGFELEALSGAETLFGKTEIFILEVSLYKFEKETPLAREVIAFMAQRGYELYDVPGHGRRPSDGALAQLDFAFVKANGTFRKSNAWAK
jgi:FkbM family methyltransferase